MGGAPVCEVGATVVRLQPVNECDRGSGEHYRVVPPWSECACPQPWRRYPHL